MRQAAISLNDDPARIAPCERSKDRPQSYELGGFQIIDHTFCDLISAKIGGQGERDCWPMFKAVSCYPICQGLHGRTANHQARLRGHWADSRVSGIHQEMPSSLVSTMAPGAHRFWLRNQERVAQLCLAHVFFKKSARLVSKRRF